MIHSFKTILNTGESRISVKASKFLGYAYPAQTTDQIVDLLHELKQTHPKATHHCYAWRLGLSPDNYRANDDGEPSGSAGRPILGQIDSAELTDLFIVVVRYYGGTKLGVPGLISAYKEAAFEALQQCKVVVNEIRTHYHISCSYENLRKLKQILSAKEVLIYDQQYLENCQFRFSIPLEHELRLIENLKATAHLWHLEKLNNA